MAEGQSDSLRRLLTEAHGRLGLRCGFRLWDDTRVPADWPENGLRIAIGDPGTIAALIRSPRLETLLGLVVAGRLAIENGSLFDLAEARPPGKLGRLARTIPKSAIFDVLRRFAFAPAGPPATIVRHGDRASARAGDAATNKANIAYHYDVSNAFYRLFLDAEMVYSCAYFAEDHHDIDRAQRDKLDLICRKLGLGPGMRLLDVGCGWASLLVHAAEHYGVHATGVTLSAQQRDYGVERVRRAGLSERVEIRLQDYRQIPAEQFDAVASIEMGEHVGQDNYPVYAAQLHRMLRPQGRLLLQQMSRGAAGANTAPGGGAFMESYVAPDMYMRPLGETLGFLERAGHEIVDVHSLREHYVWTVRPWLDTLQRHRETATRMIGEEQWRIWLLYLAGAALAFEQNRMGVHQILAVRPGPDGASGLPRSRTGVLGLDPALDGAAAAPGQVTLR